MKTQIDATTENMFAQAVALAQNGRMKSTVHVGGKMVFIQNMDHTILLRYKSAQVFEEDFSFFANDYESPRIRTEKGQVIFISHDGDLKRTKTCAAPKTAFPEIQELWDKHAPDKTNSFTVTKAAVALLDEGLSHIELSKSAEEDVKLLQRDIYSGARIEVERSMAGGGNLLDDEAQTFSFEPIGIRTVDFQALFTFVDAITFYPQEGKHWMYFEASKSSMAGILGTCLYDELGHLAKEE